jgi:manganese/zinc/iron transport system permease protein
MTLVAFDPGYAAARGVDVRRVDLAMMGLVLAVTVIGLKLVGLILIVALLIIPPVTARFWSERAEAVVWAAGAIGAVSGYVGAAVSASAPALPTGPIIVLLSAALFVLSLLFAPARGVLASIIARRAFQARVHRRQGLLALSRSEPIHDPLTLKILRRENLMRADGVATEEGRRAGERISRDERRWSIARKQHLDTALTGRYDGLTPIETVFTADEIAHFDAAMERKS